MADAWIKRSVGNADQGFGRRTAQKESSRYGYAGKGGCTAVSGSMRELIIMMAKLVWEGVVVSDARMKTLIFTRGPKQDCCPECGGTDLFNGYGTCQHCEVM